jgi:hypothetical protein
MERRIILFPILKVKCFFKKLKENKNDVTLVKIKNGAHGKGFGKKAMDFVIAFFDFYLKNEKTNWKTLTNNKDFIEIPAE